MSDFKIIDHTAEVRAAMDKAIDKALEMIGLKAEGYAKRLCAVDTGLLRNSITHAASGQQISVTYHAQYGSNTYVNKKGQTVRRSATSKNAGDVGVGTISGVMGDSSEKAEYIGTNVEYGPYLEMGTSRTKAQPYLRPAVQDHINEYARMIAACLNEI